MAKKPKPRKELQIVAWSDDWLIAPTSITKIEADYEIRKRGDPSDWWNIRWAEEWNKFQSQVQADDGIWEFSTPRTYWDEGLGYSGYVILRQGIVIATRITRMN